MSRNGLSIVDVARTPDGTMIERGEGVAGPAAARWQEEQKSEAIVAEELALDGIPVDLGTGRRIVAQAIGVEQERRRETGLIVVGVPFRLDVTTMTLLSGFSSSSNDAPVSFMTASGVPFEDISRTAIRAVHDAADTYISTLLAASMAGQVAAMQMNAAELIDFDPITDIDWPEPPSLDL